MDQNGRTEHACPAKLNLFLEVLRGREDGYHEIETVMQAVSIFDTVRLFKNRDGISIESNASWLPRGQENLAYKAAQLFFVRAGTKGGVRIEIDKHIPPAQGLGGGSSNAAGVLSGLNVLYQAGYSCEELAEMGSEIGSDVPFFLYGGTAVCRGRGEKIEPLEISNTCTYVVVMPAMEVSTREVYRYMREQGTYPDKPKGPEDVVSALEQANPALLSRCLFNRLETAAFSRFPGLQAVRDELNRNGKRVYRLTGSGSAFFLPVSDRKEGLKEMQRLEPLKQMYSCDVVCCEGNIRGTSYGNHRSEIDAGQRR